MKAVYAGSFSPPTLGHLDIIRRAAALFDEVVVAVLFQKEKKYDFTLEERLDMLRDITRGLDNVTIQADDGLLVDLVHRVGADVIVRGLRGSGDLSQEMQMAEANRQIAQSLTPELINFTQVNTWNGQLPTYVSGGAAATLPVLSLNETQPQETTEK